MPDQNLEKQIYKTYLKAIENSVGSKIFNTLVVKDLKENRVFDVLNDGENSCAYFVSGLLTLFNLIDRPHTTVETVTKKLLENDWREVSLDKAKPGDVIVWDFVTLEDGTITDHNGFYWDRKTAISTDSKQRRVVSHQLTYGEENGLPCRDITKVLHYQKF